MNKGSDMSSSSTKSQGMSVARAYKIIKNVVPKSSTNPFVECVHFEGSHIRGTDMECEITIPVTKNLNIMNAVYPRIAAPEILNGKIENEYETSSLDEAPPPLYQEDNRKCAYISCQVDYLLDALQVSEYATLKKYITITNIVLSGIYIGQEGIVASDNTIMVKVHSDNISYPEDVKPVIIIPKSIKVLIQLLKAHRGQTVTVSLAEDRFLSFTFADGIIFTTNTFEFDYADPNSVMYPLPETPPRECQYILDNSQYKDVKKLVKGEKNKIVKIENGHIVHEGKSSVRKIDTGINIDQPTIYINAVYLHKIMQTNTDKQTVLTYVAPNPNNGYKFLRADFKTKLGQNVCVILSVQGEKK